VPVLVLGIQSLYFFFSIALQRIAYPFELEWMEGAMLQQVARVLDGGSLYGEPSLAFVPALYMPLYYFVSSAVATIAGLDFFALRTVSFLATVLTFMTLFFTAREITGHWLAGVFAAMCYATLFPYSAYWFDLARVDSLWTLLLLCTFSALVSFRVQQQQRWLWVSALAWVFAFLTKQASVFLLPFLGLVVWSWGSFRLAFFYAVMIVGLTVPVLWQLHQQLGERFLFYTLQMASTHGVTVFGFQRFFNSLIFDTAGFLCVAGSFLYVVPGGWRNRLGWLWMLVGFITVSMISRAYAGAFFNVLMPMYVAFALLAGCAFYLWAQQLGSRWQRTVLAVLMSVWLPINMYRANAFDTQLQVPSESSRRANDKLLTRIKAVAGDVCVFSHGYLAYKAGKSFCAHNTQVTDLVQGSDPVLANVLKTDARQRIMRGDYAALILDREKELNDLGLQMADIPYDASPIAYPDGKIKFIVNGTSPALWLQFNPVKAALKQEK
jgi:hypothetical protein